MGPDLRISAADRVIERSARAAARRAGSTPVAVLVGAGISMERLVRTVLADSQVRLARWCGLAPRQEVLRLRELVRALEYRLQEIDDSDSSGQRHGDRS